MAFGVVDSVSGDATGLEVIEDVVVLFFCQVVVVTIDILNHSLPSGRRRVFVCANPAIAARASRVVMMVCLFIIDYSTETFRMAKAPSMSPSMKSKVVGTVSNGSKVSVKSV